MRENSELATRWSEETCLPVKCSALASCLVQKDILHEHANYDQPVLLRQPIYLQGNTVLHARDNCL